MARPPVSEQVQVNFRMPSDLRDRIKAASEASNRSMNAEIVAALEERYPPPRRPDIVELAERGGYIMQAKDDKERLRRLAEANEELRNIALWSELDLQFELHPDPDGGPKPKLVLEGLSRLRQHTASTRRSNSRPSS